jgi:hypothetical protein
MPQEDFATPYHHTAFVNQLSVGPDVGNEKPASGVTLAISD